MSNASIGLWTAAVAIGVVGISYASVPLYRIFCNVCNYNYLKNEKRTAKNEKRTAKNEKRTPKNDEPCNTTISNKIITLLYII
jgi:cytochrome c oxidase assembly protein Cox11